MPTKSVVYSNNYSMRHLLGTGHNSKHHLPANHEVIVDDPVEDHFPVSHDVVGATYHAAPTVNIRLHTENY